MGSPLWERGGVSEVVAAVARVGARRPRRGAVRGGRGRAGQEQRPRVGEGSSPSPTFVWGWARATRWRCPLPFGVLDQALASLGGPTLADGIRCGDGASRTALPTAAVAGDGGAGRAARARRRALGRLGLARAPVAVVPADRFAARCGHRDAADLAGRCSGGGLEPRRLPGWRSLCGWRRSAARRRRRCSPNGPVERCRTPPRPRRGSCAPATRCCSSRWRWPSAAARSTPRRPSAGPRWRPTACCSAASPASPRRRCAAYGPRACSGFASASRWRPRWPGWRRSRPTGRSRHSVGAAWSSRRLPGGVRFVHPLFAQALYDDLPAPVRARLHARSFEVLARRGLDAEAAEHALRAGLRDTPEVIAALERAGRAALDVGALETAASQLTTAVELAGERARHRCSWPRRRRCWVPGTRSRRPLAYERVLSRGGIGSRGAGSGAAHERPSALRQWGPRHCCRLLHGSGGSAPRRRSARGGRSTDRPSD